jgi:hypothetical protein
MPLLRTKHLRQSDRTAIGSLGHGCGGAGRNPAAPAAGLAEEGGGNDQGLTRARFVGLVGGGGHRRGHSAAQPGGGRRELCSGEAAAQWEE